MSWVDIVILIIVVVATLLGLGVGLIKAVLSLAGLVVGITLAGRYYLPLSERLTFIPQANLAQVLAFVIILIAVMLIAGLLAMLLGGLTSLVMLGWVNRLGGAVFGLVLGAILCGALLALWIKFFGPEQVTKSDLASLLLDRFALVMALLPGEFDAVRSFFR